ncbi:MAG: NAD(P)H-dependent oxidoreductase [Hyphomicrobiales bacterium]
MKKVTVFFAHPNTENSHANKIIKNVLVNNNIEVRDLIKLYPDYKINIKEEQKKLIETDIIIFQFPFYWYSFPAILKKWIDDVFTFNFAIGPEGNKLKDKICLFSTTIGGAEESYKNTGYNNYTIEEFFAPLEQLASLTQMKYASPIYEFHMSYIPDVHNSLVTVGKKAKKQANRILEFIEECNLGDYKPEKILTKES